MLISKRLLNFRSLALRLWRLFRLRRFFVAWKRLQLFCLLLPGLIVKLLAALLGFADHLGKAVL